MCINGCVCEEALTLLTCSDIVLHVSSELYIDVMSSDAKCKVLQYMTSVDNMCVLTLGAEV